VDLPNQVSECVPKMTNMIEKKSQCDQDTMRDMSMAHDNRKNDKKNYVKALHSLCEENIEKIV